ncbi:hypothetical protein [Streptomyces sp. NPDC056670]|uniref:hypothetical protein n=1 Tax=unclassified Streptomyces TaxID=2593676 RepID=UPI0036CA4F89
MNEFKDHVRLTLDGNDPDTPRKDEMRWRPAPPLEGASTDVDVSADAEAALTDAAAVLGQAQDAFFALLDVLGTGTHTMVCSVYSSLGGEVGFLQVRSDDADLIAVSEVEALTFWVTLSFGFLPGATGGLVVRTTTPDGTETARGWSVRDGWLHPLTAREVITSYSINPESGEPMDPEQGVAYLSAEVLTRPSPQPAPGNEPAEHSQSAASDRNPPNRRR